MEDRVMISEARKLAARMICFGFDGVEVNDHARRMIGKGCGACILFARNVRDPAQLSSMCGELKRLASPRKLLIMIDQEGGRVARLRPTPRTPRASSPKSSRASSAR
jgi:beta-N-acetylhexosaminidase